MRQFVKDYFAADPWTGKPWSILDGDFAQQQVLDDPSRRETAEAAFLQTELQKRDRRIKELDAKVALYEERERTRTAGLGLVCIDPSFYHNDAAHSGGGNAAVPVNQGAYCTVERVDSTSPARGILLKGDEIVAVDDEDMRGVTAARLAALCQKRLGTTTRITFRRWTSATTRSPDKTVELTREAPDFISDEGLMATILPHVRTSHPVAGCKIPIIPPAMSQAQLERCARTGCSLSLSLSLPPSPPPPSLGFSLHIAFIIVATLAPRAQWH